MQCSSIVPCIVHGMEMWIVYRIESEYINGEGCKCQGSNGVSCNKKRVEGCYVKIQEREGGIEWKVVICQSEIYIYIYIYIYILAYY